MALPTSVNTPLLYDSAGNYKYRQTLLTRREVYRKFAGDMNLRWIGPFSPDIFMVKLMAISDADYSRMPQNVKFKFPRPGSNGGIREKRLYEAFVSPAMCNSAAC